MTTALIVDAGVVVEALAGAGARGGRARRRLAGHALHAPQLLDVEVVSAMRRHVRRGNIAQRRAEDVLIDLTEMPLARYPHTPLVFAIWSVRHNISAYDATYVSLARALDAPLVTFDARLATAAQPWCDVESLIHEP